MLVADTPVSRSLSATFSELTRQPTLPELRVPVPTTMAPITGTIKMLMLSVASFELVTLVVSATAADVAPLPIVILLES